jgi:hypothetical protein
MSAPVAHWCSVVFLLLCRGLSCFFFRASFLTCLRDRFDAWPLRASSIDFTLCLVPRSLRRLFLTWALCASFLVLASQHPFFARSRHTFTVTTSRHLRELVPSHRSKTPCFAGPSLISSRLHHEMTKARAKPDSTLIWRAEDTREGQCEIFTQIPTNSANLPEQTSHQPLANNTFLLEQINTNNHPPTKRTWS